MPGWHRVSEAPIGGLAFKTAWIAGKGRDHGRVAEALGLIEPRLLDWTTGTDLAYKHGVYVVPRFGGWTLAHGGDLDRPFESVGEDKARVPWLTALSAKLGEVYCYCTHRAAEEHHWAITVDGELRREYDCCGVTGEFHASGEPTAAERAIGKGARASQESTSDWTDEDWDTSFETVRPAKTVRIERTPTRRRFPSVGVVPHPRFANSATWASAEAVAQVTGQGDLPS